MPDAAPKIEVEVVTHRLVQHRPLWLPPPVLPPLLSYLPLPSNTSPGHTLRLGSHEHPWSIVRPWFGLQNVSRTEGDSRRQVGLSGTHPWT